MTKVPLAPWSIINRQEKLMKGNIVAFEIEHNGDKGKFRFRRPTIGDSIRVGVTKARILENQIGVDDQTSGIANALATIEVLCEDRPLWFEDPERLEDFELLLRVYEGYMAEVRRFQKSTSLEDGSTD
jgi:hypothetical protein